MAGTLPLVNTEMKNVPIGTSLKRELNRKPIAQNIKACQSTVNYKQPSTNLTKRLVKKIHQLEVEDPKLSVLLERKLESPFTCRNLKKKKTTKLNVCERKVVYNELADVSASGFLENVEINLNERAGKLRPKSREPDPEPQLLDYFNPMDYVKAKKVGQVKKLREVRNNAYYSTKYEDLTRGFDTMLGNSL